ncbi:hypothetical protein [Lactiplantibacillus plantarum]|uniref:Uncharacterized protein n=1 Tax=Lactiplantibacillus plantarum TaxID=1590 RepID=A0A0E3ZR50_LACPN|nr:hypothetical protein [Lactiplantibacillus plantarum]AKD43740.1 Hypothetical protein [Lactiplantibacillus plantarum]MBS0956477.1 hypothetical protein [Lactiplantibacillus plantarum]
MKKNVNDPLKIKGIIYFCIDDSVLEKSDISKKDLFSEDFPEKESTKTLITKYSCPFLRETSNNLDCWHISMTNDEIFFFITDANKFYVCWVWKNDQELSKEFLDVQKKITKTLNRNIKIYMGNEPNHNPFKYYLWRLLLSTKNFISNSTSAYIQPVYSNQIISSSNEDLEGFITITNNPPKYPYGLITSGSICVITLISLLFMYFFCHKNTILLSAFIVSTIQLAANYIIYYFYERRHQLSFEIISLNIPEPSPKGLEDMAPHVSSSLIKDPE